MSANMVYQLRRLEKLQDKCGGNPDVKKQEEDIDTSKMSEYEVGQYRLAKQMKKIRDNIQELDGLDKNAAAARRAQLSNTIRKDIATIKKDAANVKKAARAENRKEEYEQLVSYVEKTEQLFRSRFLQQEVVGSSRVDLQACKLEYSIVSPK